MLASTSPGLDILLVSLQKTAEASIFSLSLISDILSCGLYYALVLRDSEGDNEAIDCTSWYCVAHTMENEKLVISDNRFSLVNYFIS